MYATAALLLLAVLGYSHASPPVTVPSPVTGYQSSGLCPSQYDLDADRHNLMESVSDITLKSVIPILQQQRSACGCNLPGSSWQRVAFLDADSSQPCPGNWSHIKTPLRACGRNTANSGSCDSVFYSTNGTSYSQVCGRITGLQLGSSNAFYAAVRNRVGLERAYMDGISLTRGQPGSREHVWTFANAYHDKSITLSDSPSVCPCMYRNWQYSVPSFVGNNYFCATGARATAPGGVYFPNDPLWDGLGCSSPNFCCKFNQPPWFCRTLPTTTSEDLEVRICSDQHTRNENTFIRNIEIYVK